MARAVLRITLPIEADEPISLDDALGLWTSLLRTVTDAGWMAEGARCDFEGVEP